MVHPWLLLCMWLSWDWGLIITKGIMSDWEDILKMIFSSCWLWVTSMSSEWVSLGPETCLRGTGTDRVGNGRAPEADGEYFWGNRAYAVVLVENLSYHEAGSLVYDIWSSYIRAELTVFRPVSYTPLLLVPQWCLTNHIGKVIPI